MKITRLDADSDGFESELARLTRYETDADSRIDKIAAEVIEEVRRDGDAALLSLTRRLDGFEVAAMADLEIDHQEMQRALAKLGADQRHALESAASRIRSYHEHQRADSWQFTEGDGTVLGQKVTPLDRVGLYVPGGRAAYPSSLLMNAIPARVAGVGALVMMCPTPGGVRNPLVLAAAAIAGVDRAFAIGGAQAIAALAYGTESVPRVDKIVGPGNAYVAAAKRRVFGMVGIDMIAGPSEILVIADGSTPPDWVAMDLFSQAEHDEMAQAILLCPVGAYIDAVASSLTRLLPTLARRAIAGQSLATRGALIRVRDLAAACALANRLAPEHLELSVADPHALLPAIRHAGAIFLGRHASEALGDYCAGPNHVLPTAGTARFSSPLGVYDFQKRSSIIEVSAAGAVRLGRIAIPLAEGEGLGAHAESARLRVAADLTDGKGEDRNTQGAAERVARIIRADVRAMHAYPVPDARGMVKLDAMENPYGLPPDLRVELASRLAALEVNRYPAPRADVLRERIRTTFEVPASADLMLGNGSDELISLIAMAVARPGAVVLAPLPGFVMYEMSTRFARLEFVAVPLRPDFTLERDAFLAAIRRHQPAVVYIAYPNNPTGTLFERATIEAALQEAPGLVVLDEAYRAFAPDSFMPDLARFENLAVLRTVSKSGLAGARLGYLAAHPAWIAEFDKVRPPYNINVLTQCYVDFALEHHDVLDAQARLLCSARTDLAAALSARAALEVFPSHANFILFRVRSTDAQASARVAAALAARRVLVKNMAPAHPLLANCLRVTVSSSEENATFLTALDAALTA